MSKDKRKAILEATCDTLGEVDFSVRGVARAAGVAPSLVSHYFGNTTALRKAAVLYQIDRQFQQLFAVRYDHTDERQRARSVLIHACRGARADSAPWKVLVELLNDPPTAEQMSLELGKRIQMLEPLLRSIIPSAGDNLRECSAYAFMMLIRHALTPREELQQLFLCSAEEALAQSENVVADMIVSHMFPRAGLLTRFLETP